MTKKIISCIFVLVIAIFGILTFIKNPSGVVPSLEKGLTKQAFASVESQIQSDFYKRYGWISLNGAFLRLAGIDFISEPSGTEVYRLENGAPTFNCPYVANIPEKAQAVADLSAHTDAKLLYVMLPYKVPSKDAMPQGAQDFARTDASWFLSLLEEKGVPYLDLYSQYLKEAGVPLGTEEIALDNTLHQAEAFPEEMDSLETDNSLNGNDAQRSAAEKCYGDLFFRTDHHWKISTALDAANRICRNLNERWELPYTPELLDPSAYEVTTFEKSFLGSLGKRTGIYYAGVDDFDLYLPKEETSFTFTADSANGEIRRKGPFSDTLLMLSRLRNNDLFRTNTYMTYIGGDYRINHVVNHDAENDTHVLLLRDSFSCALEPFLCMNYRELTAIDLRYYGDMSIYEYLDSHDIDVVIIALMPEMLDYDVDFRFD